MHVLVLAPHPDDESIGCGGAIYLHSQQNSRITAVFLTSGELGLPNLVKEKARQTREDEARRACSILGVSECIFLRYLDGNLLSFESEAVAKIKTIIERCMPELIYLPHPGESHLDHQAVLPLLRAALSETSFAPSLRMYEIWTPMTNFQFLENISSIMSKKLRAIRMHRSQLKNLPYDRAISGLNQYRGAIASCRYAEAFQVPEETTFRNELAVSPLFSVSVASASRLK